MNETVTKDKEVLIKEIQKYTNIIRKEFSDQVNISEDEDFNKKVHIEEIGTISLCVRNGEFYFPLEAYEVLNRFKEYDNFGSDKNHKTYNRESLLQNDNTFLDYIEHLVLIGATPLEYFQEVLLHETLHFCGSNGESALMEGINEYLTRILALKYNLKTNGCGYPKEIKIVHELVEMFGIEPIIKLSFHKSIEELLNIFDNEDDLRFAIELNKIMNEEFYDKYYKFKFPGPNGPFEKAKRYNDIDYSNALNLLEKHKTSLHSRN